MRGKRIWILLNRYLYKTQAEESDINELKPYIDIGFLQVTLNENDRVTLEVKREYKEFVKNQLNIM